MLSIPNKLLMTKSNRFFLLMASLLGATGVALGAYASHGLSSWGSAQQVEYFQLAVNYQLLHAIVLLIISVINLLMPNRYLLLSQISLLLGVCFFSGSLYLYVLMGTKIIVWITPVGGLLLILAWLFAALSFITKSRKC
ncbi:DUF423 domain-containing protein [Psychromonas sp. CD1]|uniref:DUF423 domain-containing protein n=1 Tax=Psychromonas sp. CD1 TaxID=1979839 RepID=UPI002150BDC5|nr:DUF423 domain-containing protein [Psychromonas sp. CD1]